MAMDKETIKKIQELIGTDADGLWGNQSKAALDEFLAKRNEAPVAPVSAAPAVEPKEDPGKYTLPAPRQPRVNYFDSILAGAGTSPATREILSIGKSNAARAPMDSRGARIAELEKELADVQARRKALDTEEGMAKYKFVFDADPSAYLNLKQSLRNQEATEAIRKSNEKATEQSNLKSLWESASNKNDELYWQNASYKQAFKKAQETNDANGMEDALLGIKRTQSLMDKNARQMEQLRSRMLNGMGFETEKDEGPLPVKETDYQGAIDNARNVSLMKREIGELKQTIKVDNVSIPPKQKKANGAAWLKAISEKEDDVKKSPLAEDIKSEMLLELGGLRDSVNNYMKPQSKGGQGESMTAEKFATLSAKELFNMSHSALVNYKNKGFKNRNLERALAVTAGK